MFKILIVEDDLALCTGLCFELDTSGYLTIAAYNCQKARQLIRNESFDLAIIDVNLPDGNGFALCREIKETIPGLPVIFLTANDLEEDVLAGFDVGADDYVTKPFHIQILKRRIDVALRRATPGRQTDATYFDDGFLHLDFQSLYVVRNDEKVSITPNEYKLLRLLCANAGKIVTRQLLLEKLWDCERNYIDDHTLTVTMNRLRAKLEDETHTYIRTVRGMGYIWTGGRL